MPPLIRERFRKFLAERGQTLTESRELIAATVCSMRCDFTAEELRQRLEILNAPHISRSTLFRTLDFLRQAELIAHREFAGEPHYYVTF